MTVQESKPETLTTHMRKAIRDYWYSPKGSLKRDIERCIESFERIPQNERQRGRIITRLNGTQVQYGTAVDDLVLFMCRVAFRGYDLSAYRQRIASLRSYRVENQ